MSTMATTTQCPDGCGATIPTIMVDTLRRQSDAAMIKDDKERQKAFARINTERVVCPQYRRGGRR